ncbi:pyridoxal phosphate-dependent transferase [Xylariales sp. PMI_506]|nr:pyridoxal phosphate-dependent transferase [Xylariales sp. PMI_506]
MEKEAILCNSNILDTYPEYAKTAKLDELRATEYSYLDEQSHIYLDYTGAGLAAKSQYAAHAERLANNLTGNPHSANPTSDAATQLVERTRERVLAHFRASPDEYTVIFTANASGAARLVGEAYPFGRRSRLVLTADNHNSVNGIREFAKRKHSRTVYVHSNQPDLRVDTSAVKKALGGNTSLTAKLKRALCLESGAPAQQRRRRRGLFAYPAQSNFSGVRHPLLWVDIAQERGYDVLLDAAAYLPTGTLDLSGPTKPDFVTVSWYKLFGYPTGVGCLVARRDALARLSRPWFAGGTVQAVAVGLPWHALLEADPGAFEDGTLNFLSVPDVAVGLDWLTGSSVGGLHLVEARVRCLTGWFIDRLLMLHHGDGRPMVQLYGPAGTARRGGTVCFNLLDAAGRIVDERIVAEESAAARISLRTGCFCNPGCGEDAFELEVPALRHLLFARTKTLDEYVDLLGLPSAGAIRVSFGIASNTADVDRFFEFVVETYRDRMTSNEHLAARERC